MFPTLTTEQIWIGIGPLGEAFSVCDLPPAGRHRTSKRSVGTARTSHRRGHL